MAEHGPAELGALFLPAIQSMIAERSRNHADALERLMLFGSPRIDFTAMELRYLASLFGAPEPGPTADDYVPDWAEPLAPRRKP